MHAIILTSLLFGAMPYANNCVEKVECDSIIALSNGKAFRLQMAAYRFFDGTGFTTCSALSETAQFTGFDVKRTSDINWTCGIMTFDWFFAFGYMSGDKPEGVVLANVLPPKPKPQKFVLNCKKVY